MKTNKQFPSVICLLAICASIEVFAEDEMYSPKVLTVIKIQNGSVTQRTDEHIEVTYIQTNDQKVYTSNGKTIGYSTKTQVGETKSERPYNVVSNETSLAGALDIKNPAQKEQVLQILKNNPHTVKVIRDVKKMMQDKIDANNFNFKEIESIENLITIYNLSGVSFQPMKFTIRVNFRNNSFPQKTYVVTGDQAGSGFGAELDKYDFAGYTDPNFFHLDLEFWSDRNWAVPMLKNTDFRFIEYNKSRPEIFENYKFEHRYSNAVKLISNELVDFFKTHNITTDILNELEQDSR
jgi:hypothetical protein